MDSFNKDLTEEQRLMKQSCRNFIDRVVAPFLREEWQREWNMDPAERLPDRILKAADDISIRTLGVPEKYGGCLYTHLRAHETSLHLVCRLLLEKKKHLHPLVSPMYFHVLFILSPATSTDQPKSPSPPYVL